MADVPLTEAPVKRKLDSSSDTGECKKSRESCPPVEDALDDPRGASVQFNEAKHLECKANLPEDVSANLEGHFEEHSKAAGSISVDREHLNALAAAASSVLFQVVDEVREGEVIEQDESGEEIDSDEKSGLDTENDMEDEDKDECEDEDEDEEDDVGSDEDDEESDYVSDNEEGEKRTLTSTSSSLKTESAGKDKGKAKVEDVKGKGKAVMEEEPAPGSDEDDASYLSEDPLEEVDLDNILPTRTRRRSSTYHSNFVDQVNEEEDDDDDDSDA